MEIQDRTKYNYKMCRGTREHCWFVLFVSFLLIVRETDSKPYKCQQWIDTLLEDELKTGKDSSEELLDEIDDYYLDVSNTGPCVVDSVMDFHAVLHDNTGIVPYQAWFTYKWHNDADYLDQSQRANFQSNITSYMFDDDLVLPNNYTMTVCVYRKKKRRQKLIAEGSTVFRLTEMLNGHTKFEQNSTIQKNANIFATNDTVQMTVHITDTFIIKPTFHYMWFVNGSYISNTTENVLEFVIPTRTTGPVDVYVQVHEGGSQTKGKWSHTIIFEDEVKSGSIVNMATGMISAGEPFILNVTFDGSNVTLCWMIEGQHGTKEKTNYTCTERIEDRRWYSFNTTVPEMGYYKAHATVKNDVSEIRLTSQMLYAFDPEPSASSSVAIPVVFGIIGFAIILVGVIYVLRLRKKHPVEVANFDFHPTLYKSKSSISFHNLNTTVKNLFSRNKYSTQHRHPKFKHSTARSYGTLNEDPNAIL